MGTLEESHPEWVRGLKLPLLFDVYLYVMSHPEWVRGLKLAVAVVESIVARRTPSGCVD